MIALPYGGGGAVAAVCGWPPSGCDPTAVCCFRTCVFATLPPTLQHIV